LALKRAVILGSEGRAGLRRLAVGSVFVKKRRGQVGEM